MPVKVAALALGALTHCDAAGFTSHNTAARRTSQFEYFGPASETFNPDSYFGLATDRSDAIQGGAPFPDYLYACGDEHDAGEEAHWTPFQMAAAEYIRKTYPNWETEGRDSDGAGLVAFMLGVTSHYIADINWHGLETVPAAEGLIRSMGFADFNCTNGDLCQIAHSAADTGGEFAAASMLNLNWYPEEKWYIPTSDLVNIYAAMNETGDGPLVEPQWINECAVIFYAGSWALSTFGDLVYPVLAPYLGSTLLEKYLDFHLGGIDDDAAWTGFMQNRFADWVSNGPPEEAPNFQDKSKKDRRGKDDYMFSSGRQKEGELQRGLVRALRAILGEESTVQFIATISASGKGSFVGRSGAFGDISEATLQRVASAVVEAYAVPLLKELGGNEAVESMLEDIEISRQKINARVKVLTSGMPLSSKKEKDQTQTASISVQEVYNGQDAHEYFGHSVTIADFSGSGKKCDILVGSYGAGRIGGPQEGASRILFNAACGSGGRGEIVTDIMLLRGTPSDTYSPSYERFGWSTGAADLNGDGLSDAIICAPSFGGKNVTAAVGNYTGRCDVFFGPFTPSKDELSTPAPDLSIYGDSKWGTFGDVLTTGDVDGDGALDLIISAPGAGSYSNIAPDDHGELSNQGAVYVFLARTLISTLKSKSKGPVTLIAADDADKVLQPTGSYGWFGKSLLVIPAVDEISPLLVVGAPTYHPQNIELSESDRNSAVGRVFMYAVGTTQAISSLEADNYVLAVTGCGHAGRTGQSLAYSKSLSAIAFAEPSYNVSGRSMLRTQSELGKSVLGHHGLRAGRVVVAQLSSLFNLQKSDVRMCDIADGAAMSVVITGDDMEGRFGLSLAFNGAATDSNTKERSITDILMVGAPLARDGVGTVFGYSLSINERKNEMTSKMEFAIQGDTLDGEKKSRFGRTIVFGPWHTNSTQYSFFASAPLADLGFSAPDDDQRGRLVRVSVKV